MKFDSIAEIYDANAAIREQLKATLAGITETEAAALPEGEKWTIAQIVEHMSIVEDGMGRICSKLLSRAMTSGRPFNSNVTLSEGFLQKGTELNRIKVEAPDMVRPSGNRSIAESLARMDESRRKLEEIKPKFESYDGNSDSFPHPFLGDLTAIEWLTMVGAHEMRHLNQIIKLLEKIRK